MTDTPPADPKATTPAGGAPGAEAVTAAAEAPSTVVARPTPVVDELEGMRERRRLERGAGENNYAHAAASPEFKNYVNQLLGMAGLEPIAEVPITSSGDNTRE